MTASKSSQKLRRRIICATCLLSTFALALSGCGKGTTTVASNEIELPIIKVGSLDNAAGLYLGELYSSAISGLGYRQLKSGVKSYSTEADLANALKSGDIDVAPVSVASMLEAVTADAQTATSRAQLNVELLQREFGDSYIVLPASKAVVGYVFVMLKTTSDQLGATGFADLALSKASISIAAPANCFSLEALASHTRTVHPVTCGASIKGGYSTITFTSSREVANDEAAFAALDTRAAQIAAVSSLAPQIVDGAKYVVLSDSQGVQPADVVSGIGRARALDRDVTKVLNKVNAGLTPEELSKATQKIQSGVAPSVVAACDAASMALAVMPAEGCK